MKMKSRQFALLAATATALFMASPLLQAQGAATQGSSSSAQGSQAQGKAKGSSLSSAERKFLMTAAQHNMAEVEVGKMAEGKAASPEAKKFGQQMVQDHSKALDEVTQLAKSKSVDLPADIDRAHKNEAKNLEKLSGTNFDRKYMDSMVRDHEKDVKEFRKMSKSAKDPEVRALAEKTLPVLEGHLQMAKQVASTTSTGAKR
jgi:putative membrane protein